MTDVATGTVAVDAGGALLGDGTGIVVGVPAGSFDATRQMSVTRLSESELPYTLPSGWNFAAGVSIVGDEQATNHPLSVAIPAPAGAVPGQDFYLMQPVDVYLADGTIERSWRLIDAMIVGTDGIARTTSPPNIGVGAQFVEQRSGLAVQTFGYGGLLHDVAEPDGLSRSSR